jgi:NAD(P)H-hydrate repair Nnr-like enzyme with NAD(P)H-hydrate dehydratase domain
VLVKLDAELYHYDTCGRDDVWFENGVISRKTAYGPANSIIDADGLQALIDRAGPAAPCFAILTPAG